MSGVGRATDHPIHVVALRRYLCVIRFNVLGDVHAAKGLSHGEQALLSPYSPALLNGRLKCPDGKFEAQRADFKPRGQIKLPKSAIMADIPAIMADIPALMADLDARRWADLLSQIPHSPIQNPCEYGDSGPDPAVPNGPS